MIQLLRSWHKKLAERPRLQRELIFAAIIIFAALVVLLPIRHAGWPQNHEGLAFVDRIAIYADHMRQGDLLPIWSSSDAFGMGTPLPLFYHKTFYIVASPLYVLVGAMKVTVVLSILLFMLLGAYGMRQAASRFTNRRALLYGVPVAFLFANYTFTDWLIRGAMAEFSAMMLIPWLIWWCLVLVQDKRFSLAVIPIFFFLFNAHNVTAMYAVLLPLTAAVIYLARERWAGVLLVWKRAIIAAGALLLLVTPQLLLQHAFLGDYNPGKITQAGFSASENLRNTGTYFVNPEYTWLEDWRTYTVQIDYGIWVALVLGAVVLGVIIRRKPRLAKRWMRSQLLTPTFLLLSVSLLGMFILQCKFMKSTYEHVQVLQYLQFPWRLLAFITPLGILLVAYAAAQVKLRRAVQIGVVVWVSVFVLCSPLPHHFAYGFIPQDFMDSIGTPRAGGLGDGLTGIGEYLPRVTQDGKELTSMEVLDEYREMFTGLRQAEALEGSCTITPLPLASFDSTVQRFTADCTERSTVALPISYSRFHEVRITGKDGQVPIERRQEDPRLIVQLPAGNDMPIEVKLPTVPRVLTKLL